jgi:hypothetical protein
MGKVYSRHFFPDRHAILLGYAAGGKVLRTNNRNQPADTKLSESVVAAGAGGFGREALSPVIAAHVIGNLDFVRSVYLLNHEAAIPD